MSQLMLEQQKSGLEVSAIVHRNAADYEADVHEWYGCKVYNVKSYGQLAYAPVAPGFLLILRKALSEIKPDIVHIHMPNMSAFWLLLLGIFNKSSAKWIVHWHSDVVGAAPDLKIKLLYPFYRLFERWLLSKAEAVICTSPNYLETSKPLVTYRQKCHVIPLGIEAALTEIPGLEPGSASANAATLKLICIGRLTYYKGHKYLLGAINQLVQQHIGVHLDVVGTGELQQQLQAYVAAHNLQSYVRFYGTVDEASKQLLISQSDLLCLPSIERTEAFGVVLLEAAALAKPALVTDVPGSGMSYVVKENQTGLIAQAANDINLAEKLIWASKNKAALTAMGKQAQLRQQQLFSIDAVAEKIKQLYECKASPSS